MVVSFAADLTGVEFDGVVVLRVFGDLLGRVADQQLVVLRVGRPRLVASSRPLSCRWWGIVMASLLPVSQWRGELLHAEKL